LGRISIYGQSKLGDFIQHIVCAWGWLKAYHLLCVILRYLQLVFAVAMRAICRPHMAICAQGAKQKLKASFCGSL
jgi:hypothetical protein